MKLMDDGVFQVSSEDLEKITVKKLSAEKIGAYIWRMNAVAVAVNHLRVESTLHYDRSQAPEHWFVWDIMTRDLSPEYIINKWKDWTLVHSDGSEESIDPRQVSAALAEYRNKIKT